MNAIETMLGMYVTQIFLHAFVAHFVVEAALRIFEVRSPRAQFRYRILVLTLPLGLFWGFQALDENRGSIYFRQDLALFDAWRWLDLRVGVFPAGPVLAAALVLGTTALVVAQELLPVLRRPRGGARPTVPTPPDLAVLALEFAGRMRLPPGDVVVLDDPAPVLLASGTRRPTVIASTGVLRLLGRRQLRAAVAHELAHVRRRSNAVTALLYLCRLLAFFSPVALITFRRMVQDEEQVCDDLAAAYSGDREAMASALERFLVGGDATPTTLQGFRDRLEDRSHDLQLRDRIGRLRAAEPATSAPASPGPFLLAFAAIVAVCYWVV
jgi:Zn-dependent protease with chaperone function